MVQTKTKQFNKGLKMNIDLTKIEWAVFVVQPKESDNIKLIDINSNSVYKLIETNNVNNMHFEYNGIVFFKIDENEFVEFTNVISKHEKLQRMMIEKRMNINFTEETNPVDFGLNLMFDTTTPHFVIDWIVYNPHVFGGIDFLTKLVENKAKLTEKIKRRMRLMKSMFLSALIGEKLNIGVTEHHIMFEYVSNDTYLTLKTLYSNKELEEYYSSVYFESINKTPLLKDLFDLLLLNQKTCNMCLQGFKHSDATNVNINLYDDSQLFKILQLSGNSMEMLDCIIEKKQARLSNKFLLRIQYLSLDGLLRY